MKKSVKTLLTVLLILNVASSAMSQILIDYSKERKNLVSIGCSSFDTASVNKTLKNLTDIDPSRLTNGHYEFYYDNGMAYYMKAALDDNYDLFYTSISYFEKCIKVDPKRGDAYHNISLMYYFLKKYDLANANLQLYKKYTKKKYQDKDLIARIEKEKK